MLSASVKFYKREKRRVKPEALIVTHLRHYQLSMRTWF
jgi:hypothetical protein